MPAMLALLALMSQTPACTTVAPPPAGLESWTSPKSVTAARDTRTAAAWPMGSAARVTLSPTPGIQYAVTPEKPGAADSHGGLFTFRVAQAGRYRVALGSAAWIDVIRDGKSLTSVTHGHGPQCSGIRKMVDFDLTPGSYLLQIAGSKEAHVTAMIAPAPKE